MSKQYHSDICFDWSCFGVDNKTTTANRLVTSTADGEVTKYAYDAAGRMGWGKWCDDNGIFIVAPGLKNDIYWEPKVFCRGINAFFAKKSVFLQHGTLGDHRFP